MMLAGGLALFSLCIGSLLNVIIYRLPRMILREHLQECSALMNLFFPRSFCPACNKTIKARHNIPLLSYFMLHRRCYACKKPISLRYPLVEFLSLVFALLALWLFGFGLKLLFALVFIWFIIALFFIDLEHQLLPDSLTLGLLWLGLLANTQSLFTSLEEAVFSAVAAYLCLWILIKLYYLITGKIGMGHGDFKLFAAFGAWFGWPLLPFILFFASFTGAIAGILYLWLQKKDKDTPIPFGPFLCVGGGLALFCTTIIGSPI